MSGQPTSRFAALSVKGQDAAAFLQGYLTADLDHLDTERALPMALCNIKGRVIASGWASGEASHARLLIAASVADGLSAELVKYLAFSKSKLTRAAAVRLSPNPSPGAVELPPSGWFASFDAEADAAHAEFASASAGAGFVVVTEPIAGAFLPQMIGLTAAGAVSFSKGCYLGQEVVARAEHRGAVKQSLRRYRLNGAPPPIGAQVMDATRKIGAIVALGTDFALAATRSDASPVTAADCRLTIADVGDAG